MCVASYNIANLTQIPLQCVCICFCDVYVCPNACAMYTEINKSIANYRFIDRLKAKTDISQLIADLSSLTQELEHQFPRDDLC